VEPLESVARAIMCSSFRDRGVMRTDHWRQPNWIYSRPGRAGFHVRPPSAETVDHVTGPLSPDPRHAADIDGMPSPRWLRQ